MTKSNKTWNVIGMNPKLFENTFNIGSVYKKMCLQISRATSCDFGYLLCFKDGKKALVQVHYICGGLLWRLKYTLLINSIKINSYFSKTGLYLSFSIWSVIVM